MTKVFIVLTAVLSVALSCLFIAAAAQWTNWRELAQRYQQLQEAAVVQKMNQEVVAAAQLALMDDALQGSRLALEEAQRQNRDQANELVNVRNELARQRHEAVAADADRKKLQELLSVHTAELIALRQQNDVLLNQNIDLQTRNTRLNGRVLELTSNLTISTDQVRNLQEKLYAAEQALKRLQEAQVAGRSAAAVAPGAVPVLPVVAGPIRGEIVKVEGNYASISIGESSGVVAGMTFMVHRGPAFLAELVIDRVWPQEAAGKLKTVQQEVRPGDTVGYGYESTAD